MVAVLDASKPEIIADEREVQEVIIASAWMIYYANRMQVKRRISWLRGYEIIAPYFDISK